MMFLGIGIIHTEKCWPNSPTYSTDVGVLRGSGYIHDSRVHSQGDYVHDRRVYKWKAML